MNPMDASGALLFGTVGGVLQGVLLGTVLTAAAAVLIRYVLRLNASTRFAVWLAALPVLCAITIVPAVRRGTGESIEPPRVAAAASPVPAAHRATPTPEVNRVSPMRAPEPARGAFHLELRVDRDLPVVVFALYLVVVGYLTLRLSLGYVHLRRLKCRSKPAPPELALRWDRWLRQSECRRRADLRVSSEARGPFAAGFLRPAVIVPESLLLGITSDELDGVALHELAHIRRYDDWTTLLQRVVRMLFFFHPAIHWVCRELEFDREVACDDSVVAITGAARSYARSLTRVSELTPSRRAPVLASGAVFRTSHIRRRIELLLNAARDRTPRISMMSFALVLLVVIGIASDFATLPAFVSLVDGGDHFRSRWTTGDRTTEFEMAGQVEFGDDDASVIHMSPNGLVRVEERTGWSGRRIEIRNGTSGTPQVHYFLHGRERPLDETGRAWLASILPRVIRESGINAEERAKRILDRDGPAALLQEADRIANDHSRRRYLLTGIQSGRFGVGELQQTMRSVSRMSSDNEKANLLIEASGDVLTPELRTWFFDAVNSIASDHDRRRVISKVVSEAETDQEMLVLAARSAQRIGSDHEKSEILKQIAPDMMLSDAKVRRSVLQAAATIGSDHDKAEVLATLLRPRTADADAVAEIVRVAESIQSDSDKARLLEQLPAESVTSGTARTAFFAAVRTIQSASDSARVLTRFLAQAEASGDLLEEACRSARGIASDDQKANVLITAHPPLPPACFDAIRSIGSDHNKRRVLERLLLSNASQENARAAVEAAGTIASDHEKAEVLMRAAQQQPDDQTRAAIRKVAQGISSDEAYRRVTSKLPERATP
jgi:beta-lactamase regulating signal transducer with metallopeptidase domain